jgi:hypothetical protein
VELPQQSSYGEPELKFRFPSHPSTVVPVRRREGEGMAKDRRCSSHCPNSSNWRAVTSSLDREEEEEEEEEEEDKT